MKLLHLDLRAFGPFTDMTLDLSAGQEGLHILYGPNEAGKSSALRALRQFFFGIPARCADDFLHPYKNLRIGAKVRQSDGTILELIRRKANSNTLRGPDDSSVVNPEKLQQLLGGLDGKLFETMFGIDHAALVEGGKEIVRGGGHFGEILFAASAGLAGLRQVQDGLAKQMRELFLPTGFIPRINKLVQEYTQARKDLKDRQLSHEEWSRHARALREALEQKKGLEAEVQENSREQSRRKRIGSALQAIATRKQVLRDLEDYQNVVLLRDDFGEERRQVQTELQLAARAAEDARQALADIEVKLSQIQVPEALIDQAARVEDLFRRLGAHQKNLTDRPTRDVQKRTLEHEAKEILRSLGKAPDLEQAEQLRLRKDETLRIQNLGNQYLGLLANRNNARTAIELREGRIAEAGRKLAELPPVPDLAELRREIRLTLKLGEPESDLTQREELLAGTERQADLDLARLPYWSANVDALERLPVPGEETIEEFETAVAELTQRLAGLDQRLAEEEKSIRSLEEQIRRLELQQEVPTEENLRSARQQRATGWDLVRRAWLEHQEDAPVVAAFVNDLAPDRHLVDAYEHSVRKADDVVDRLRREADRVAQKASFISQLDGVRHQIETMAAQRTEVVAHLEEKQQAWFALLQSRGLPALRLSETRTWLEARAKLVDQAAAVRDLREEAARLRQTVATSRQRLGACLLALGKPGPRSDESLAGLLERCQEVVTNCEHLKAAREKLQENLEGNEGELRTAQSQSRTADQQLADWLAKWTPLMARLGLGPDALPEVANQYLGSIDDLLERLSKADDFRRRIVGMDRDTGMFTQDVQALAGQVAADLMDGSAEDIAIKLQARLGRARTALGDRENLREQQERESTKLRDTQQSLGEAEVRLQALCQEAGCRTADELPQAEERSRKRKELEQDLHKVEEQIRQCSAGATVEDMVAEAEQVDADTLDSEIQRLEECLAGLRQEISAIDQTIGSERNDLARMDGNEAAAQAAENAESRLAQLQTEVPQYVTLRLASTILQRAVDRYRDKNQGPVLAQASQVFAHLTAGSFSGLRIDYDDQDKAVLMGVRADGTLIGVAGMSDGSGDQLYLALRLATLEVWLESHEPIPFIVDDILLNFDDDRAAAALNALAGLARRTQVIFFTHHQHLVELGQKHLDQAETIIHCLPGRPVQSTGAKAI